MIRIPPRLIHAVDEDDIPARHAWLAAIPAQIEEIAATWSLELGEPWLRAGHCAWVAPVRDAAGRELILKVGWRHREAEHEADALRLWDGDAAVRCLAAENHGDTAALLLERCVPGLPLASVLAELEQDVVVAKLLRRLSAHRPPAAHPFRALKDMCDDWADEFQVAFEADSRELDPDLAREGIRLLRQLPRTADDAVLVCTDLHAENILAAKREPWLVVDPKPLIGDPAFDVVQHMFNCEERLAADPLALAGRMAALLDLDRDRVMQWLFARSVQEAITDRTARGLAQRLAGAIG
jgi:streptomycin 6-kinase